MLGASVESSLAYPSLLGKRACYAGLEQAPRLALALLLFRLVSALLLLPFGEQFSTLVASLCKLDRT